MIKKLSLLIAVLCVALCSCSCKKQENVSQSEHSVEVFQQSEYVEEKAITVSPFAKEDFLVPLDKYSWDREYAPEYVMLHFTSAVVISKDDPYNMSLIRGIFEDNEVSINYIVDRDGSVLCYIPEDRAAWHAGKGTFGGDERFTDAMNKYSIGIEIVAMGSQKDMAQYMSAQEYNELCDSLKEFTDEQYLSLKALVKDICQRNDIPFDKEHVIGHDMYNPQKNDPGELFDYNRIFE